MGTVVYKCMNCEFETDIFFSGLKHADREHHVEIVKK